MRWLNCFATTCVASTPWICAIEEVWCALNPKPSRGQAPAMHERNESMRWEQIYSHQHLQITTKKWRFPLNQNATTFKVQEWIIIKAVRLCKQCKFKFYIRNAFIRYHHDPRSARPLSKPAHLHCSLTNHTRDVVATTSNAEQQSTINNKGQTASQVTSKPSWQFPSLSRPGL